MNTFLIWSHEHGAWWGPNHCGYVRDIKEAGRYSAEDAAKIVENATFDWSRPPNEVPVRIEDLPEGVLDDDAARRATSDHVGAAIEALRDNFDVGAFTGSESREKWVEALAASGFTRIAMWYDDWCRRHPA